MNSVASILLKRPVSAILVPSGQPVLLEAGTPVQITQALGGSYTVLVNGGMARIEGRDADALDQVPLPAAETTPEPSAKDGPVDEEEVWKQLRSCYDPEIPVNIVDLGLVYDCQITPLSTGGNRVDVKMTLTAPGCGMAEPIRMDVESKIRALPGVSEVNVEVVWDPPWSQDMLSEAARLELGLL